MVDVREFGEFVNGNHATLINAAIQSGHDIQIPNSGWLPNGAYVIDTPLLGNKNGQTIRGGSPYRCVLTSPPDLTSALHLFRMSHTHCVLENLQIQPGHANHIPVVVYTAWVTIQRNRIFPAANGQGTGILLTTTDPVTSATISGAYNNTVRDNWLGYWGLQHQRAILAQGQNGNRYTGNHAIGDEFIDSSNGGGNLYGFNTLQSETGTINTKAGYAINLNASGVGEMVIGNYGERYLALVKTTRTDNTYKVFGLTNNHYDNCGAHYSKPSGLTNYSDDEESSGSIADNSIALAKLNSACFASQAEAEAGEENTKLLTSLRTAQAIAALATGGGGGTFSELTGGTAIGDMTSGQALSAAFDGTTSKALANCIQSAAYTLVGYVGKNWGAAKTVTRYDIWGSSDYGYDLTGSTGSTITIVSKLYGSNNGTSWTLLHTATAFQDNNTTNAKSVTSGITTGSYSYHKVELTSANGGGVVLAQAKFYETL